MKKLLAGLVLATSLAACTERAPQVIAIPQTQATDVRPGAMTVTGSATLEVSPDCADLTMTLSTDGARPAVAATALSKKQQEVIDAMKKLGIEAADMKISHITLTPIYKDWQQLKLVTYRAEITITATTKQFDQIAAMMEAGANAGATTMTSQFRRSDLPELKKKVREMALKAAKEKAQTTAKALGIELGRVTTVAEAPAGLMWQSRYFPNYVGNEAAQAPAAAQTVGGALQPLTLDVTVGYELAKDA
jgi:hypothetical protein